MSLPHVHLLHPERRFRQGWIKGRASRANARGTNLLIKSAKTLIFINKNLVSLCPHYVNVEQIFKGYLFEGCQIISLFWFHPKGF
jgi:hypothetical protein